MKKACIVQRRRKMATKLWTKNEVRTAKNQGSILKTDVRAQA